WQGRRGFDLVWVNSTGRRFRRTAMRTLTGLIGCLGGGSDGRGGLSYSLSGRGGASSSVRLRGFGDASICFLRGRASVTFPPTFPFARIFVEFPEGPAARVSGPVPVPGGQFYNLTPAGGRMKLLYSGTPYPELRLELTGAFLYDSYPNSLELTGRVTLLSSPL